MVSSIVQLQKLTPFSYNLTDNKKKYIVTVEEKLPKCNCSADLVARKGDVVIILKVKTGIVNIVVKQQIREISDTVKHYYPNAKFRLVYVNYPDESSIHIENADEIITDYFISNGIPSDSEMTFPFIMKATLRMENDGYTVDGVEALRIDTSGLYE